MLDIGPLYENEDGKSAVGQRERFMGYVLSVCLESRLDFSLRKGHEICNQ